MRRLALTLVAASILAAGCERQPGQVTSMTGPSPVDQRGCAAEMQVARTQFDELGGQTSLTVTSTSPGCFWGLTHPDWMTVTPQPNGVGSRTLTLSVAPSRDTRDGSVTLGDHTVVVHQAPLLLLEVSCGSGYPGQGAFCFAAIKLARPGAFLAFGPDADTSGFGRGWQPLHYWGQADDGFTEYDLSFIIPSWLPAGPVDIPFRVGDREGRVATVTKQFTVLSR